MQNKKWGQWAEFDNKYAVDAAVYGSHIPFGRVVYSAEQTSSQAEYHERAANHSVMLPHEDGDAKFTDSLGNAIPALNTFTQRDGKNHIYGVTVESSFYDKPMPLFGLDAQSDGCISYGQKQCDSIPVARTGAVYVPLCTDVKVGDKVGFLIKTPDAADATQGYGVIGNLNDPDLGANMRELVGAEFRTNGTKGSGATVYLNLTGK
ncbi:structural cement protein Gp24 [Formosimonas limnophila]|nr:hypothetical protein [Formosimonas limnophila]